MNVRWAVLLLCALGLARAGSVLAQFVFFPVTEPFDEPGGVCLGPDGNVWFAVGNFSVRSRVGRITLAGAVTEFFLPDATAGGGDIVAGPDGNLWFLEGFAGRVGRISPAGAVTEFPIPEATRPGSIVVGPDGAIWVSDFFSAIWRVSLSGSFTKYPVSGGPYGLATGSDRNLWFTDSGSYRIGRMTASGAVTFFSRPSQEYASDCALGPDGNIWYTVFGRRFGRTTPSGAINEFQLDGDRGRYVTSVAVGPDGNLWMPVDEDLVCPLSCTDYTKDGILQVSTDGVQTRYDLPKNWISESAKITKGPQGSMWFTAQGGLVRFFPAQLAALGPTPQSIPTTGFLGRLTLISLLALAGFALLRR